MHRNEVAAQPTQAVAPAQPLPARYWARFVNILTWFAAVGRALSRLAARTAVSSVKQVRRSRRLYVMDIASASLALVAAFFLRYGFDAMSSRPELIWALATTGPQYILACALAFPVAGLYGRDWRYCSVSDLRSILQAVVISSAALVLMSFFANRLQDMPRSVVPLEALLLTAFLSASRLSFRLDELALRPTRRQPIAEDNGDLIPTLLVGSGHAADLYLRALRRDPHCNHKPVGCLEATPEHTDMTLRGIPILGALADFDRVVRELSESGQAPRHLVFTEALSTFGEGAEDVMRRAEARGMTVSRLTQITELKSAKQESRFELRSIELTDLLERPQAALDNEAILRLVRGRRVLITGAGGSIGSELTLQVAAREPAELILVENCEYNLYAIDMELGERYPGVKRTANLCNVRRANRVNDVFARYRPELVFHAAALKHVPMVELNPCEGVLTNVIGTMNVANAARRFKVQAMVQVSTDKVVNPTSVMGGTKRLAELYCQALDLHCLKKGSGPRFMTVRFGNVLGSSGSLIPLFKRQIAKGGPLTVTDPRMTRFFMTIREAVELTLQASAYGLEGDIGKGEIFVLDMNEPIKIIDIAKRMIRLAGLTPGKDIDIEIIGLRPGEKLYEELFDSNEQRITSPIPGVLGAIPNAVPLSTLKEMFARLKLFAELGDQAMVFAIMNSLIPGFDKHSTEGTTAPFDGEDTALDAEGAHLSEDVLQAALSSLRRGPPSTPMPM
ncbi:polysaccharide biosynthesis protein [Ensifer sp.]|jgi:O-antigen biosynthesis protein WbqV|uniref:polysaccharide biosynthesis protein n=1 Tax=Ensifer sp. TaxID=1872086 RepID=UPI0039C87809